VPVIDTPENVAAAERATRESNVHFMTVMLEGRYLDATGADAPDFTDEEMRTIGAPLDFVGINVYRPTWYVEASDDESGARNVPINASHPKMGAHRHGEVVVVARSRTVETRTVR
jgi:beta-glucosidase